MSLVTDFRCPGGRQRVEAFLTNGKLRIVPVDGSPRSPSTEAFAEAVENKHYATVAMAERALQGNGVAPSESTFWRSAEHARPC